MAVAQHRLPFCITVWSTYYSVAGESGGTVTADAAGNPLRRQWLPARLGVGRAVSSFLLTPALQRRATAPYFSRARRGFMPETALVTGAAGFIGSHLVDRLLRDGWNVTGVDNFDDFYAAGLKRSNVAEHLTHPAYTLVEADIRDPDTLVARLTRRYDVVVHLAAKAGVRPSIANPILYQDVNVRGTQNVLEFARARQIPQFVFASSSSVYGVNRNVPWSEEDHVLQPISPYASTKVSGELLGHVYSHLYGMRFVALRFFTVYGPRQRPDLAIRKFSQMILNGERVPFYGDGSSRRDYTFVNDIVDGIVAAMRYRATPFEVINLGNNRAVTLGELVREIEEVLGISALLMLLPDQPGDVPQTWASVDKAAHLLGYRPTTSLRSGLEQFASWLAAFRSAPVGGGKAEFFGRDVIPMRAVPQVNC